MEEIIAKRHQAVQHYDVELNFRRQQKLVLREGTSWNNSYYPIIAISQAHLIVLEQKLNAHGIFPRRYFYPSLHNLPYVNPQQMEVSARIASSILCLPLFAGLESKDIKAICSLTND